MATLERRLALATLGVLVLYLPLETWVSLPALWSPFHLVDVVGMLLMEQLRLGRLEVAP